MTSKVQLVEAHPRAIPSGSEVSVFVFLSHAASIPVEEAASETKIYKMLGDPGKEDVGGIRFCCRCFDDRYGLFGFPAGDDE